MPANKKHLTKSLWQRFAKITAAILGGYLVTATLHLALSAWFDKTVVLITMTFTGFILWVTLMILAFLASNGWKVWATYLSLSGICCLITYFGNH